MLALFDKDAEVHNALQCICKKRLIPMSNVEVESIQTFPGWVHPRFLWQHLFLLPGWLCPAGGERGRRGRGGVWLSGRRWRLQVMTRWPYQWHRWPQGWGGGIKKQRSRFGAKAQSWRCNNSAWRCNTTAAWRCTCNTTAPPLFFLALSSFLEQFYQKVKK